MKLANLALAFLLAPTGPALAQDPPYAEPAQRHAMDRGMVDQNPMKMREHAHLEKLVVDAAVTRRAVRSGGWSDPATWDGGITPSTGDRVLIPADTTVTLDGDLTRAELAWIRVDGTLSAQPNVDTALAVATLVVRMGGTLAIGTPAAPIRPDVTARVVFCDRGPRDRSGDPHDLTGGLIGHGALTICGARHTSHVASAEPLRQGASTITLQRAPEGWRPGDEILVPGVDPYEDQDEVIELAAIRGRVITLARGLAHDHETQLGVALPIGNLTRNVIFESAEPDLIDRRGHIMIMHAQTGVVIDGATFRGLGRTDTRAAHTIPEVGDDGVTLEGSDQNTIGRYAVHFHIRSGARRDVVPNVFRNCSIIDSPKHGLVNHGGHVVAEHNVTYRIAGSHFFTENGSEVGAFRHNLAVRSAGSGDLLKSREAIFDHGHEGHGFWLQSGGVVVEDNFAFGHAEAGFFLFTQFFVEGGEMTWFASHNLEDPSLARGEDKVMIGDVPFHMARNVACGSEHGFVTWSHKMFATHDAHSLIEDCKVFGVRNGAFSVPYTVGLTLRNVAAIAHPDTPSEFGVSGNEVTASIVVENASLSGFNIGVRAPRRGDNAIRGGVLANRQNIYFRSSNAPGRRIEIDGVAFEVGARPLVWNIYLHGMEVPPDGNVAMLFEDDRITWRPRPGGALRQLYYLEQRPDAVPFPSNTIVGLSGKTTEQIHRELGLAIAGAVAPADAVGRGRIHGLVGDPTAVMPAGICEASFSPAAAGEPEGWQVVPASPGGPGRVVFLDRTPPRVEMHRGVVEAIHPDDLEYGFRACGWWVDEVGDVTYRQAFIEDFSDLVPDEDGYVRVSFSVTDRAGNTTEHPMEIEVTERAVRRGRNVTWFDQAQHGAPGSKGRYEFDEGAGREGARDEVEEERWPFAWLVLLGGLGLIGGLGLVGLVVRIRGR